MALNQTDMQWLDQKFGEVHASVNEKHTAVVQRLSSVETKASTLEKAVSEHTRPCDEVKSAKEDVRKLRGQMIKVVVALAAGGSGVAAAIKALL